MTLSGEPAADRLARYLEPTRNDLAAWARLAREAAAAAGDPGGPTGDLEKAARRAFKSRLPRPPLHRDNPFVGFQRRCAAFAGASAERRRSMAASLAAEAEARGAELAQLRAARPDGSGAPAAPAAARLPYAEEG